MAETPAHASANASAVSGLGVKRIKRLQTMGHYEPSFEAVLIPKCPVCGEANPRGLDICPKPGCNTPAPLHRERRVETPVITDPSIIFPWHARLLLWIGARLQRIADWIERTCT
jgi:hypothetical protein